MSLKKNPIIWQGGNHETHETCVDDRRNPCEQRRLTFGAFHSLVIVLGAITITVSPAVALVITPIFDSTWGSAPMAATTAVQDVITEFETWFDNPITTTINFSWGNSTVNPNNASLGITDFPNQSNGQCCGNFGPQYTFSQTTTLLTNASMAQPNNGILANAITHFPPSYPNPGGSANFYIGDAEFLALAGTSQNSDPIHAFVGFQSGQNYDFKDDKPKGNETDFHAVAEHEVSHAMGRVEYALSGTPQGLLQGGGPPPFLTPLDFYKYNVVTHALDPNRNETQFSIDGTGLHLPTEKNAFNSPTIRFFDTGSDSSDWIGNIGVVEKDSFNRFITTGVGASVTPIDLVKMEALGWDPRTPCYMECINRWTELPLSLASSLTAVIGGNVVDEIDLAATQSNPAINPFAYVNQNFFGGTGTSFVKAFLDSSGNTEITYSGSNPILTSYQFDYGPDSNGNPHYGFQGLAGSQPLNIVSQFWSEIDTGREPELPGWFASCPAIAGPIVQYAVLYGQGTARGQTVGEWQECPAGSDSPIWTITNPNGFDETLSDFGFLLSPFAIDLNLLNFNGVLPPDQSLSPLSPLSSLDGTILAAGQSVTASAAPEPTSLAILGVALAGFGFARRRRAL